MLVNCGRHPINLQSSQISKSVFEGLNYQTGTHCEHYTMCVSGALHKGQALHSLARTNEYLDL